MPDFSQFDPPNPDATLALAYASAKWRDDFSALIALDAQLGRIFHSVREPMLAQIRFAWWREALHGLRADSTPPDPVLAAASSLVARHDVKGDDLAGLVNGWETLLESHASDEEGLLRFAEQRGGGLFTLAAAVAQSPPNPTISGCGSAWALADLAMRSPDSVTSTTALALAGRLQRASRAADMPVRLRPFATLARFGERDVIDGPQRRARPGSPRRLFQALSFALWRR